MARLRTPPAVTGQPLVFLRLEGAVLLAAATYLYQSTGASWWLYAALFLAPDLSFAGYFGGPRVGAIVYNIAHTIIGPLALGICGLYTRTPLAVQCSLIWLAHIGFDHLLGYGLKYNNGFAFTHLGRLRGEDEEE
jgi:Domain of unknown function (DUF4260)